MAAGEFLGTVGLAVGTGVATFFSPCAYALLPGYVSYYVATAAPEGPPPVGGALIRGASAVAGVFVVFGALSAVAVAVGQAIEGYLPVLEALVGVLLVALGVVVALDLGIGWHVALPERRAGVLGFGAFGALYAVAATGCVAPLFLALVVQSFSLPPLQAIAVFGAYAGSFGALMLGATVATAAGVRLTAETVSEYVRPLVRAAGVALILAGLVQLYLVATPGAGL